jgi:hypothetical protein
VLSPGILQQGGLTEKKQLKVFKPDVEQYGKDIVVR